LLNIQPPAMRLLVEEGAGCGKGKSGGHRTITFYSGAVNLGISPDLVFEWGKIEFGEERMQRSPRPDKRSCYGVQSTRANAEEIVMTRKAFGKIADGLNEALSIARGETKRFKLHVPSELDVRAIRKELGMSQEDFGLEFGFTLDQIRNWEQRRTRPTHGERTYLLLIAHKAKEIMKLRDEVRRKSRAA
jgi:putative transcriptional regulator